jgi:hypothetical protein
MVRYEGGQVRRKFADPYADQDEKTKTKMGKRNGKEKWEREMGNDEEKSERR